MKNKIYELVITGGPCAGKSTCLAMVEQELSDRGIKVLTIAETATEVMQSGISFDLRPQVFQGIIIENSLKKEQSARVAAAEYAKRSPVVILYDRGVTDARAYMPHKLFNQVLEKNGTNEIAVRDAYDGVFHLVTAARGAEKFYTLANNGVRRENLAQARRADARTLNAWNGAPHLRIIDNSTEFKDKIGRLMSEIFVTLGLPKPTEIERKYLIEKPSQDTLRKLGAVKSEILQTYLKHDDSGAERRVRQRGIGGDYSYYYTEKLAVPDTRGARIEYENKISQKEYLAHIMDGVGAPVRKDRFCFVHNSQYFELDIYPYAGWEDRALLEIELAREDQKIEIPKCIRVIRDVTDDMNYRNSRIIR